MMWVCVCVCVRAGLAVLVITLLHPRLSVGRKEELAERTFQSDTTDEPLIDVDSILHAHTYTHLLLLLSFGDKYYIYTCVMLED